MAAQRGRCVKQAPQSGNLGKVPVQRHMVRCPAQGWIPVSCICHWQHTEGLKPRFTNPSSVSLSICFALQPQVLQPQPLRGNTKMENKQRLCPLAGCSWRALPPPRVVQVKRFSLAQRSLVLCCLVHVGFDSVSQAGCQARVLFYTLSPPPDCGFPPQSSWFSPAISVSAFSPTSTSEQAGQLCIPSSLHLTPSGNGS